MKIAQIAPLVERIPPKKYGGTERVIYALTEELVRRGHEVTLFASGDSRTSARLVSVYPKSLREAKIANLYGSNAWSMLNTGLAYQMQNEFDVIHDHTEVRGLPTANMATTPAVFTVHGAFSPENKRIFQVLNKPSLVTISKAQALHGKNLNIAGNVYNGLNFDGYPFSEKPENYLLYVGRISMEKGVHYAIETAIELGLPLIIAAKLEPPDESYFRHYIEPYLSESIRWIGEVDQEERNRLMSKALCFLHPVTWREPFGLTLIEALACGCPVVAFNQGSIPEIIQDGKVGFVVSDLEGMLDAVSMIDKINRATCRTYVAENFSDKKMAEGYEEIYKSLVSKR